MSLDNEIVTKMDKALKAVEDPHTERPWRRDPDRPLPPEHFDGCTCPSNCNLHEENTDDD